MRRLSYYVLRQIVGPFLMFTTLLAIVVWLTQSLRLLDLVLNRSQSAAMFAYLSLLIIPQLLTVIIPIAFFAGAIYALHRLNNDSELVVMWAAGFSRLQLAAPILLAAFIAMGMTYACNMYLMPVAERTMKDAVFDIRANIGAAILHEGSFTTPTDGLTVFIRALDANDVIHGLLVHDNRDPKRPITYIAKTGMLVQTQNGTRLIMQDGNVEQSEQNGTLLSVLKFDKYVFSLDQFSGPPRDSSISTSELFLPDLLNPQLKGDRQRRHYNAYVADGHNRIASPLYCLAFALIALAATAKGRMARASYALRLSVASVAAAGLRVLGYAMQAMAAKHPELIVFFYLIPIIGAVVAGADFMGAALPNFRPPAQPAEQAP